MEKNPALAQLAKAIITRNKPNTTNICKKPINSSVPVYRSGLDIWARKFCLQWINVDDSYVLLPPLLELKRFCSNVVKRYTRADINVGVVP